MIEANNVIMTSLRYTHSVFMCHPRKLSDIFEAIEKSAKSGLFVVAYFGDYHKLKYESILTKCGFKIVYMDNTDVYYIVW